MHLCERNTRKHLFFILELELETKTTLENKTRTGTLRHDISLEKKRKEKNATKMITLASPWEITNEPPQRKTSISKRPMGKQHSVVISQRKRKNEYC